MLHLFQYTWKNPLSRKMGIIKHGPKEFRIVVFTMFEIASGSLIFDEWKRGKIRSERAVCADYRNDLAEVGDPVSYTAGHSIS